MHHNAKNRHARHLRDKSPRPSRWAVALTVAKYLFALCLACYGFSRTHAPDTLLLSLVELALVFVASNALARRSRLVANVVNDVLMLLLDLQQVLLVFSNTFLTLVMITNLSSIEDISGKVVVYGAAAVAMLVFALMPIAHLDLPLPRPLKTRGAAVALAVVLCAAEAASLWAFGLRKSPLFDYVDLALQHVQSARMAQQARERDNLTLEFYHAEVTDHRPKSRELAEEPNVVLIFTEGLSQSIVDDDRSIMPNVARYEQESLNFTSYYNHTFATYRGLSGQLFSGYQHDNLDKNTLVSLPQLLAKKGYATRFINSEPSNREFYSYLTTLGFDQVLDYPDEKHHGPVGNDFSDGETYQKLFDVMEELGEGDAPFLLSVYTFGTHATLDSCDQKFGDGTDSVLNKFYDVDYQFGKFMERFRASDQYDDTIVVFTADHATYADMYFTDAFPDYDREHMELDEIPLFIYHKGVIPEQVDVRGRNTLCLVPTILDYLDVSDENYFLGTSLFAPTSTAGDIEYHFDDVAQVDLTTRDDRIHTTTPDKTGAMVEVVQNYYAAKQQEALVP